MVKATCHDWEICLLGHCFVVECNGPPAMPLPDKVMRVQKIVKSNSSSLLYFVAEMES